MKKTRRISRRSSFEYRDDRNHELLKVFKRELLRFTGDPLEVVLQRTVDSPSSRFWVSEERAFRVVSWMHRNPLPSNCSPLKREMFEEIARQCVSLAGTRPGWSLARRVYYVVNHEAPKFYLSVERAHAIICQERKRCRDLQAKRWRQILSA